MKRLIFCLLLGVFTGSISAQEKTITVLFPATPEGDGTYEITYGTTHGILEGYVGRVMALYVRKNDIRFIKKRYKGFRAF